MYSAATISFLNKQCRAESGQKNMGSFDQVISVKKSCWNSNPRWSDSRLLGSASMFARCFAEYNPASIKFKIQLSAYYHIPEIKLFRFPARESLIPGKSVEFVVKIINPTQHQTFVEILDLVSRWKWAGWIKSLIENWKLHRDRISRISEDPTLFRRFVVLLTVDRLTYHSS